MNKIEIPTYIFCSVTSGVLVYILRRTFLKIFLCLKNKITKRIKVFNANFYDEEINHQLLICFSSKNINEIPKVTLFINNQSHLLFYDMSNNTEKNIVKYYYRLNDEAKYNLYHMSENKRNKLAIQISVANKIYKLRMTDSSNAIEKHKLQYFEYWKDFENKTYFFKERSKI